MTPQVRRPAVVVWTGSGLGVLPGGDTVDAERRRLVAMGACRADVLVADLRAVLDEVEERHGMAAADAVVLGEPVQDDARLRVGAVAALRRLIEEGRRRLAGLRLDGVDV